MAVLSLYKKAWKSATLDNFKDFIFNPERCILIFILLFFLEIFVNCFVIQNIKYTEIDWQAYMQEVEGFLNGTTDYNKLQGDTGPLVYPAGFVYIFAGLYHLTNGGVNVTRAQYIFAVFYQLTLITIFFIYSRVKKTPPYAFFFMCCASYRIHSIFLLRLFNDPVAMLLFYAAVCCMLVHRWSVACLLYSISVSVKMNLLLFAPGLLLLLRQRFSLLHTLLHLSLCALVQLLLGLPFLLTNPSSYLQRAFEFSRQFLFVWTVNWRFLDEKVFLDRRFHALLLLCHLSVLYAFIHLYWIRKHGGLKAFVTHFFSINNKHETPSSPTTTSNNTSVTTTTTTTTTTNTPPTPSTSKHPSSTLLSPDHVVTMLFVCNFIGVCFSRSLHYQFYAWYFHSLPHILWTTRLSSPIRLVLLGVIEMCWNTYPSTTLSSASLHLCHLTILLALFHSIIIIPTPHGGGDDSDPETHPRDVSPKDVDYKRQKIKKIA